MTYFGYPLDIHGWKTKPGFGFGAPNPETVSEKRIEIRWFPTRNHPAAILIYIRAVNFFFFKNDKSR